jgi:hypothetical protein
MKGLIFSEAFTGSEVQGSKVQNRSKKSSVVGSEFNQNTLLNAKAAKIKKNAPLMRYSKTMGMR